MIPWVFIAVFNIMCSAHSGNYQPNQVITVALGDTVSLQCSVTGDTILWFKQFAGYQPQIMSVFQSIGETKFYKEFHNDRFQRNNFNLTISRIVRSDEAVYHCGEKNYYVTFGRGTHLKIKVAVDQKNSRITASTISKSDHLNVCTESQQNYKNDTEQVKTEKQQDLVVFGMAVALGICAVLIFILICLVLKKGICEQRLKHSGPISDVRGSPGAQDSDDDILTYAALRFSRQKGKPKEKEKSSSRV